MAKKLNQIFGNFWYAHFHETFCLFLIQATFIDRFDEIRYGSLYRHSLEVKSVDCRHRRQAFFSENFAGRIYRDDT